MFAYHPWVKLETFDFVKDDRSACSVCLAQLFGGSENSYMHCVTCRLWTCGSDDCMPTYWTGRQLCRSCETTD